MLSAYPAERAPDLAADGPTASGSAAGPTWIDLFSPTDKEVDYVCKATGLRVPTREDLSEIESTSRLYEQDGALYLSTPLVFRSADPSESGLTPTGFVLTPEVLITIRYERTGAFDVARKSLEGRRDLCSSDVLTHILETVVDRAADLLEGVGAELDALSRETFADPNSVRAKEDKPLRRRLRRLGLVGNRLSQVRDALLGVGRIAPFVAETGKAWVPDDVQGRLGGVKRDIDSLNDYEGHLSNKVQFLLDAVLGFINIEQNDVVKVLTIVSVVGVPPVLVVGVYGMNFKHMPELDWRLGYPFALGLMVVSALAPLLWFRIKRWF